jgi:DNA ligase 1
MPDLLDGQAVTVRGNTATYQLKNVGGVLSCSCPAWRHQSLPIDRRTCKHLLAYCGGTTADHSSPPMLAARSVMPKPPPLLLAETWDGQTDSTGWLMSEKLDGVRAWWDGKQFLSRQGHRYLAPDWFTAGLPLVPLDGELWLGRGRFDQTASIVRRADGGEAWRQLRFLIFDAPGEAGSFPNRLEQVQLIMAECQPRFAHAHPHKVCRSHAHLEEELDSVLSLGGEGLMLREPASEYVVGRSCSLLKVKRFQELDAVVVGHTTGRGRHRDRLGALVAELPGSIRFQVGSGLSDRVRSVPPPVGTVITVQYQELTAGGVPRFPVFVRVRADLSLIPDTKGAELMPATVGVHRRRFEFVGGTSAKYWEVQCQDQAVAVHFGRLGTSGQEQTKTFATTAEADCHAENLIREKLGKGYVEVS